MEQSDKQNSHLFGAVVIGLIAAGGYLLPVGLVTAILNGEFINIPGILTYTGLGLLIFPDGLFFPFRPQLLEGGAGAIFFSMIGYLLYMGVIFCARYWYKAAFVILILLLALNAVGCHVQRSNFNAMF